MANKNDITPSNFNTDEDSKFVDKLLINTKSDLIVITADKLENILLKHLEKLSARKAWLMPLSLFITVLLASLTSTFTLKLGITAATRKDFALTTERRMSNGRTFTTVLR